MPEVAERYTRLADRFEQTVRTVRHEQWGDPTPCPDWDVRRLVEHVANNAGVFLKLVGEPEPDLPPVAIDPLATWQASDASVRDALATPAIANREYDGYFGKSTFAEAIDSFLSFDLVVHRWDLAHATGQDETIEAADITDVYRAAEGFGDALRLGGVCGAAMEPPPGADEQTKLLAYLGRMP